MGKVNAFDTSQRTEQEWTTGTEARDPSKRSVSLFVACPCGDLGLLSYLGFRQL